MAKDDQSTQRRKRRAKPIRDKKEVIYCLEGIWRHDTEDSYDQRSQDSSVRPLLEYLKVNEYWDFRHRNVATLEEVAYYLEYEWSKCTLGSLLWLPMHGSPGCICPSSGTDIYLTESVKPTSVPPGTPDLARLLSNQGYCEDCHVHFSGCAIMENYRDWIDDFMWYSGAAVVSGFIKDNIGWSDISLPGVLAEMMLFSALEGVNYSDKRNFGKRMERIQIAMNERFDDCEFFYKTRK